MSADMNNTYWLLRHGRSLANEAGVIISKKENGIKEQWSLAPMGQEQAKQAGVKLKKELEAAAGVGPGDKAVDAVKLQVYCSPFSRTVLTAKLASGEAGLDVSDPTRFQMVDALMERDFGLELEETPYSGAYEDLWARDNLDMNCKSAEDGETLEDVCTRIRALFKELEERHNGIHILLVAHGDTLSILQATMEGADPRMHTKYQFNTGELRKLGAGPSKP